MEREWEIEAILGKYPSVQRKTFSALLLSAEICEKR